MQNDQAKSSVKENLINELMDKKFEKLEGGQFLCGPIDCCDCGCSCCYYGVCMSS